MTINQLLDEFREELTPKAIEVIELTDQNGLGDFTSPEEFNDYVEMYY